MFPNPRASVHNQDNWIFDLEGPPTPPTPETPQIYENLDGHISKAESDSETPPLYHHFPSPERPIASSASDALVKVGPLPLDHVTAIDNLHTEIVGLSGELTT